MFPDDLVIIWYCVRQFEILSENLEYFFEGNKSLLNFFCSETFL